MTPPERPDARAGSADQLLLVVRAQSGDRSALDLVLRWLQSPLHSHILAIVRDSDTAADVLQDTFFTIARKLPTLRDPRWMRAWAYRIATREAIHGSHAERRWAEALRGEDLNLLPVPDPEENFDPALIASIPALVDGLSPASGVIVRMHYLDGLTHTEIAEALEIPVGTVKSRLSYGLAALRKELA